VLEQDTDCRRLPSIFDLLQLNDPGLPVASAWPDSSTATHSEAAGQETPVSADSGSIAAVDHDAAASPLTSAS
jgi:hypothetical protein